MPIAEDPEPRPAEGRDPDGVDPSGTGGKDPFDELVLDEEFVRGAAVKEQAGRTRMLAAQWKHTPPVDPGGRRSVNDGPPKRFGRTPKPVELDPWGNPRPRRRRRLEWRAPLYVALTVAVLLAALNVGSLKSWYSTHFGSDSGGPAAATAPVPTVAPETARPTTAPPRVDPQQPTVDHPWAGSPAEGWPTTMDAFDLTAPAGAIGVFTAEQVAAQVKLVKEYLAAANLDPKAVAGGTPEAALALLDREEQDNARAALTKPSTENDPTAWFSRFDPRDAIPVSDTVRMQGLITVEGDGDKGVLVHTDFTYVYALRPGPEAGKRAATPQPATPRPTATPPPAGDGGGPRPVGWTVPAADVAGDTWTTRTIVRRVDTFRFYDPARYRVSPKKLVFGKSQSDVGNSACASSDGFYHPQFDQFATRLPGAPAEPQPTGPATDPYDRTKDLTDGNQECGTISRN
ncbi:hypothetical protein OH807_18045 [Kitasatospora sp. NBC_01560]|uniref:SCO2583/SCO2584 N-terminal domain-containing protein n=1 Tax=Kitasatospora sp. NBC_01560 TaxID=2975965 RepID=UPI003866F5EB